MSFFLKGEAPLLNARQQRLTSAGLCGVCGKRPLKTALRCQECHAKRLESQRAKRNPVERSDVALPQFTPSHEYAEIFPLHEGQPLWDLSDRIKKHGLRKKIVTLDKKVLDGRRRERACQRAGVKPEYREFGSLKTDGADPLEFVMDENLHHRHLGEGERAICAARYATAKRGQPKKPPGESEEVIPQLAGLKNPPTTSEAAEKFGVSEDKVERAKAVLANGTPALQEAVADDTVSVSDAANVAKEPPAVQDAAVDAVKKGKAKSATAAANTANQEQNGDDSNDICRDDWGIPVQPHAEEAFKAQEKFDELLSLLRKADRLYSDIAEMPGGAYLIRPGISINARDRWKHKGIKTALMNITDCRPTYTVCPRAFHAKAFPDSNFVHDEDCPLCHGLNWSRQLRKEEVQEEVIEAVKGAFGCSN